jgi:integrase/recombinase XerD
VDSAASGVEPAALQDLVEEFSRRSGIAPATRAAYRAHLAIFLPWAAERGLVAAEELTPDVIDEYARSLERRLTLKGAPLAAASRRAYLKGVQQFLSWLAKRKQVEGIDSRQVDLPRLRRQHRGVLSRAEVQLVEDAAPTERNKLMIRLLADTGCREGAIPGIRCDDVIVRESRFFFVRVRDKTGERLPPVRPELYRRLRAHAAGKTGRPRTSSPYLFMSSRRRPHGDYEPLTEDGVYQAVKDAVARSGIERRVYPHLLKHSAISWMVHRQMNPAVISEITGTSLAVIVSHYLEVPDRERYEAMMRLFEGE